MQQKLSNPVELDRNFSVGVTDKCVVDTSRTREIEGRETGRRLYLKIWYPTSGMEPEQKPENLWQQLEDAENVPFLMRLMARFAARKSTCSYPDAPPLASKGNLKIVIYNHGLVSFASENTNLMELLSARGYVVISIEHQDQLNEYRRLFGSQSLEIRKADRITQRDIRKAKGQVRAELSRLFFKNAELTNRIVSERARDTAYVVDALQEVIGPLFPSACLAQSSKRVAVLGFSVGGAVGGEFANTDSRACAVVNLDGGIYGTCQGHQIQQPYLMVYSDQNEGSNSTSLQSTKSVISTVCYPKSKHLNLHDVCSILPWMRWTGIIGSANPRSVLRWRNQVVLDFLERVL